MRERRAWPIAVAALLGCACLIAAAVAWARPALTIHASFSPDRLGASTNLSIDAKLLSSTAHPPPPVTKFVLYAPAGMGIDVRGAGTCDLATLERKGPSGCPENSRAGFGGGVGVLELPSETIHAPYTLDFFFAPKVNGHLRLLIYASASSPAPIEFVLVAKEIPAPKPYGLGFSVEVPPISTIPGAANASIESAFVSVGGAHVAYYESVHGKKKLVHLRGLIVPKRCPSGGFPTAGKIDFADGATLTVNPTIPCPHR
ncbi:MAG TPA: hypothetical protein VFY36_02795 [Solirubrobacteraceae bacterium]|nr:hypothetical protein [Solirubrobacteraceae bacterium]